MTLGSEAELSFEYTPLLWLDDTEPVPSRQAWPCHSVPKPQRLIRAPRRICKETINPCLPPMLDNSDFIGLGRGLYISVYLNMGPSPPEHTASWFECTVQSRTSNFTPWTWTSLPMSFILHALPWRVVQMHTQLGVVDDGSPLVPSKNMSWIDQNAITMFQPWLCITITKKIKKWQHLYKKNKFIDFYRFIYK